MKVKFVIRMAVGYTFFFRERLRRPTHVLHSPLSPKKIRMLIHGKNDKILLIYLEHQCFIPFENCSFVGWSY